MCVGDYTTRLTIIRMPINQPGFNGKQEGIFRGPGEQNTGAPEIETSWDGFSKNHQQKAKMEPKDMERV